MLRFAICDDIEAVCTQIEEFLTKESIERNLSIEIDKYYDGKELKVALQSKEYDCVFLDIEIGSISGIDVSKFLRETLNNENTEIIFISRHSQYAMELFDFDPITFLIKPIDYAQFLKALNKFLRRYGVDEEYFALKSGNGVCKIPLKDILYFETKDHKVELHKTTEILKFYDKMENISALLENKKFIRIHKSFLVNSKHIRRFTYQSVFLDNGEELIISQPKRKYVREWLINNF